MTQASTSIVAHTRGPWTVQGVQSTSVGTEKIMAKTDALGYVFVADVYPPHNDQMTVYGGERDANARLIAAAPELLAAMERLMNCGPNARLKEWRAAMAKAEAAFAKATGQ